MNLSDTSIEATPTKTNRSALQYSPRDELDLSRSNSSQADSIVSLTARENAQLRTENARLEQENDRLEQENVHLKKELARLNGTNLQERRCLKPWSQLGRERKRRLLKDILEMYKMWQTIMIPQLSVSLQTSCTEVHLLSRDMIF